MGFALETPSGRGVYLTVYPSSRPNTDTKSMKDGTRRVATEVNILEVDIMMVAMMIVEILIVEIMIVDTMIIETVI